MSLVSHGIQMIWEQLLDLYVSWGTSDEKMCIFVICNMYCTFILFLRYVSLLYFPSAYVKHFCVSVGPLNGRWWRYVLTCPSVCVCIRACRRGYCFNQLAVEFSSCIIMCHCLFWDKFVVVLLLHNTIVVSYDWSTRKCTLEFDNYSSDLQWFIRCTISAQF